MDLALSHIENWVFDLDNTLYPPECALFDLIDLKMREYIMSLLGISNDDAHVVQKRFFHDHGTTLAGLMVNHGVDPHDFLAFVHDIDLARLSDAPRLRDAIAILPGRKIIFTNADAQYAGRVLGKLGLDGVFSDIVDVHDMGYKPKPQLPAYAALLDRTGIDPTRAVLIEDMARNLVHAKDVGMTTIWVNNGSEYGSAGADTSFIDIEIPNLADWLAGLLLTERAA